MMTGQNKNDHGTRKNAGGRRRGAPQKAENPPEESSVYVYGIFPGDITLDSGVTGVGDPPGKVRVIRSGDIAALVSDVSASWSLGSPADLSAHKELLDASASAVPVLPMRFGAVVSSDDAVEKDLLAANHDLFATALSELDGLVQYVVKGRYAEEAILREVLSEDREAARLRDRIRSPDPNVSHAAKIRLGEVVHRAVAAKRDNDTYVLANRVAPHCEASVLREPAHERDAVHIALLVRTSEAERLQGSVDDLAGEWDGRMNLRLLGPMAAYDFVGNTGPAA